MFALNPGESNGSQFANLPNAYFDGNNSLVESVAEVQDLEQIRMELREENERIRTQEHRLRLAFEKYQGELEKLQREKHQVRKAKEQVRFESNRVSAMREEFEY